MPRLACTRHIGGYHCTCAMGNIYRFIEPVVLRMLRDKGKSYGYDLSESLPHYALTDALIERAALYRTLRTLEQNGYVTSMWDGTGTGPARRVYALSPEGHTHLAEWADVMRRLGEALIDFSEHVSAGAA